MSIQNTSITRVNDLTLWQESHKLMLLVYQAVNDFRDDETLPVAFRLRRLAKSVTRGIGNALGGSEMSERAEAYVFAEQSLNELRQCLSEVMDSGYVEHAGGRAVIKQIGIANRVLQRLRMGGSQV